MEQESITAWFSYAGQQHPLVVGICDWLKEDKVEGMVQAAKARAEHTSETRFEHVRLVAKRYRIDGEDDKIGGPIYALPPGGAINDLLFDIANSPVRVMVLSETYFNSQPCLNELCLSLCAMDTGKSKLPMLILVDFDNDSKVLNGGEFTFATSPDKPQTLLEALIATHIALGVQLDQMKSSKRGFDLSTDFRQKLPDILDELSKLVFVPMKQDEGKGYTEAAAIGAYRYCNSYMGRIGCSAHDNVVMGLYINWCESEFSSQLNSKLVYQFSDIVTYKDARVFLKQVYQALENTRSLCRQAGAKQMILRLYGLVILKLLKSTGANLLSALDKDTLINVNVEANDDRERDFENAIHAALSYCANQGFAPRLSINAGVDHKMVDGVVMPHRVTICGAGKNELLYAFQELLAYLTPFDDRPKDIDQLDDPKYIGRLREGLEDIDSGNYGLLVLNGLRDRDKNGAYSILEKLEDIINKGYDERLSIPCVILRADTSPNGEVGHNLLFSSSAYYLFESQFAHINNLFSQH